MEAFTLAARRAICRTTCVEECAQCRLTCVQECVRASQWNRSHLSTHSVTSLHVINTGDARDTHTLSTHMCPSAFTLGRKSLDKSLDMSIDLRPSVKALLLTTAVVIVVILLITLAAVRRTVAHCCRIQTTSVRKTRRVDAAFLL